MTSPTNNQQLHCIIVSPNETLFEGDMYAVKLPAYSGVMEVLPGHAELFCLLKEGNIVLEDDNGETKTVAVKEAGCHVYHNQLVVTVK